MNVLESGSLFMVVNLNGKNEDYSEISSSSGKIDQEFPAAPADFVVEDLNTSPCGSDSNLLPLVTDFKGNDNIDITDLGELLPFEGDYEVCSQLNL